MSEQDNKFGVGAPLDNQQAGPQADTSSTPSEKKAASDSFLPPSDFDLDIEASNPFETEVFITDTPLVEKGKKVDVAPPVFSEEKVPDEVAFVEVQEDDPYIALTKSADWEAFPLKEDHYHAEKSETVTVLDALSADESEIGHSEDFSAESFSVLPSLEEDVEDLGGEDNSAWFDFKELTVEELEQLAPVEFSDEELPDFTPGGFSSVFSQDDEASNDYSDSEETISLIRDPSDMYGRVLLALYEAEDLGVDATAKARIGEEMKEDKLPQIIARDLINKRVVNSVQLARAVARVLKRKEITSFLNVPAEAGELRGSLDTRAVSILRESRVIPLWIRSVGKGQQELHLAHETAMKDLVLESALKDLMPNTTFVWHFAQRDVCGAFWLAGESEDIDSSMEAEALLDRIVGNAIDARSSDIHIDPSIKGEAKAIVKYRVDGFVQSKEVITLDQLDRLRVRIENISRMPKVDLHHPNKGAFSRNGFDWRVQVQPHAGRQGPLPRIVIRRLQPDVLPMEVLGYPEYFVEKVKAASQAPNGVIFWTGPTGSGKTESIHSAVVSANPMGRGLSVHTIEDPPEKRVPGYAVQMEISDVDPARSGLQLLKSSLRADPDVVIFGEVRDSEMAGLVFEAANTGHLVFTTLHTNTSLDAIVRLDEMGMYGFHISYVRGIAAQRLVRRLCTHCRIPMDTPDEYTRYVFQKYGVDLEGAKLFTHNPDGCVSCQHRGYYGRIAIAEWLQPNKEMVEASTRREYDQLEEIAKRAGWKPMGYMGVLHVKNGITDCAELSSKVLELSGEIL